MTTVNVLNGPNLNRLGLREPDVYGNTTYAELVAVIARTATELGLKAVVRQSDSEAELIDLIHRAADAGEVVQGQQIALHTQTDDHAGCDRADVAVVPEFFAREHV